MSKISEELRTRINPLYATQLGTESFERLVCAKEIERLEAELDRVTKLAHGQHTELYNMRLELARLKQQKPIGEMVRNYGIAGGAFARWGTEPPIGANLYLAAGAQTEQIKALTAQIEELQQFAMMQKEYREPDDVLFGKIEQAAHASYQRHKLSCGGQQGRRSDSYEAHLVWAAMVVEGSQPSCKWPTCHSADFEELLAERSWLPIETAPKDGSHVQLFRPEIQFVGYYGGAGSGWRINAPGFPAMWPEPTHWAYLRKAPNAGIQRASPASGEAPLE